MALATVLQLNDVWQSCFVSAVAGAIQTKRISSYACQQVLLNLNSDIRAILDFICAPSNKPANRGIYLARQLYFKTGRTRNKAKLHRLLKSNLHFQALDYHTAQQTLTAVAESFSSFLALANAWHSSKLPDTPKLSNYQKKSLSEQYGLRFVEIEESYTCLFCGWGLSAYSWCKTCISMPAVMGRLIY